MLFQYDPVSNLLVVNLLILEFQLIKLIDGNICLGYV